MYYKKYIFIIVIASLSAIVVSSTSGAIAYLVKPAMDEIFVSKDKSMLTLIPLAFVGIMLFKGLCRFLQIYLMNTVSLRVSETVRNEVFDKILRLPMRYFEKSQVGMLMSRVTSDINGVQHIMPAAVMFVRECLTCVGLISVILHQNWRMAVWALVVLPLAIYPIFYFGRKLRKIGRKGQKISASLATILQENLSGIRVIKAFANEDKSSKGFQVTSHDVVTNGLRAILHNELSSRFMELIGAFGVGLVLWYGGSQVIDGHSTPGTFFSFIAAVMMLYDPIKKMSNSYNTVQSSLASCERVFALLDSPHVSVEDGGAHVLERPIGNVELKSVFFRYSDEDQWALNDVSFCVKPGEKVALVGPSGAGKTTLANLLPRFYDCTEGSIVIGDKGLRDYTLDSLRLNIGLVSQDTFLFNTSIRDNIAYGREEVDDEVVFNAAKAAYAHDFISTMPEGYDTVIGERGTKLSGGQKQRITIARALLKNPSLLILDEATSALDTESERIVQMALENLMKERTSIVIAHRLSTILSADKILVMENGKVIAAGKHEELLGNNELYTRLYKLQFENGEE
ncbi:MAG: ABC transporter ATP-binding protein [Desulfovibrio sp.]